MLDVKYILNNQDEFIAGMKLRKFDSYDLDKIEALDAERRGRITRINELREARNEYSEMFPQYPEGSTSRGTLRAKVIGINDEIKRNEHALNFFGDELRNIMLTIPNLPRYVVPKASTSLYSGTYETPTLRAAKPHWQIAEDLGILDIQRGVKISGTGFYVLKGKGAALQRALINWMLDVHTQSGYEEVYVPNIVSPASATANGNLPKFKDSMYHSDSHYLIPTAEVAITNLHRDEIIPVSELPKKYVAHTPCYRDEHASAGADNRGIHRVNQFEKVEIYQFNAPDVYTYNDMIAHIMYNIMKQLKITYRMAYLTADDIGFQASDTLDIEMYLPVSDQWVEVSSISHCTDFQARRANIKYKDEDGKNKLVHTYNGSGLALPRVIMAILENYQMDDGGVEMPEVLKNYLTFERIG